MTLEFNHVLPNPLSSIQHGAQSLWGNSFRLEAGQKVLVDAASGKGKSTFTNLLFGLRNDFSGEILFDGTSIRSYNIEDWVKLRKEKMAVVFQDLQLFPDFTVRENLLIKNQLCALFSEEEIQAMLSRLGLGSKWNDACAILSMGQQQRIAILRSLLQPFKWLVMDEPFSHLDAENAHIAWELILEIAHKNKAGVILTSLGQKPHYTFDQTLYL